MKRIFTLATLLLFCGILAGTICAEPKPLVVTGRDGKLAYTPDDRGNRIPDFSRSGYMGGGVAIPHFPANEVLAPTLGESDDTGRIQAAIDKLSARAADESGLRGVLLLQRGTYRVSGSLQIQSSGIILRGDGPGKDGTTLLATGKEQRTLIHVHGKARIREVKGSRRKITDDYVPWGSSQMHLESTEGMSVGDAIVVHRPSTANWIHDIGMDRLVEREGTKQWKAGSYDLRFERVITEIEGKQITLDAPIVNSIDQEYGGGSVYRITAQGRISSVGVEDLRLVSEYEKDKEDEDEAHAWTGVSLDHAVNCWVRNITTVHFSHSISLGGMAKFVTVQDCACLKPVSLITGGRRYPFSIHGQYCLIQRCYSNQARHAQSTGSTVRGPNVFLDCLAENTYADTGPHHRWAVGTLWDNLAGGTFNAQDRGNMGSGHGWAGAQQVFWNCVTEQICIQRPPTAQNYAIGCTGKMSPGHLKDRKPGLYQSHGTHVEPRSLYLWQLEERLGKAAVENVTTPAQRRGVIYDELKQQLAE